MDTKKEMSECGQCHKMVAEANFALHETHCKRFLCLCPDCDETVPREQLDQHREEQHTLVKCSKCNKKVERCYLMDHESDHCAERLQTCLFCKLLLPWKELGQHQYICGSRTELCGDCRCYVTLRDQPVHWTTCPATSAPSQTNSNPSSDTTKSRVRRDRCKASIPAQGTEKHKLRCHPSNPFDDLEKATQANTRRTASLFSIQETQPAPGSSHTAASFSDRVRDGGDDIGTCPHCHLTLPIPTLLRHQVKCQIQLQRLPTSSPKGGKN